MSHDQTVAWFGWNHQCIYCFSSVPQEEAMLKLQYRQMCNGLWQRIRKVNMMKKAMNVKMWWSCILLYMLINELTYWVILESYALMLLSYCSRIISRFRLEPRSTSGCTDAYRIWVSRNQDLALDALYDLGIMCSAKNVAPLIYRNHCTFFNYSLFSFEIIVSHTVSRIRKMF